MDDSDKSREQLIEELAQLRREVAQRSAESRQPSSSSVEELLRTIVAHVPIIAFALDMEGIITLSEGQGLEDLGMKPGEMVGKPALELYGDLPELPKCLQRAVNNATSSTQVELSGIIYDIWHTPQYDAEGRPVGLAGIAVDVTERERAQREQRAARILNEQMLQSHDRDRRLLAYEIHDGLVQDATAAQMHLEALLQSGQLSSPEAQQTVTLAKDLVRKAVVEARQVVSGLRPPILDELGVVPALEYLVEQRQSEQCAITFQADVQFDRLESLQEATIYRIVQEALGNAIEHGQSDRVEVRVRQHGDRLHLEIQDWGVGFDPASVMESRFGLQGIRERARLLQGRVSVDSTPGEGTRVFVDLPIARTLEEVATANTRSIE